MAPDRSDVTLSAGLRDSLTSSLEKIDAAFKEFRGTVEDVGDEALDTSMDYRTLGETINRAAPHKESEQFDVLSEAIEKVGRDAEGGVYPLEDLRRTVRVLGAQSDLSSEQMEQLQDNLSRVFQSGLSARASIDQFNDVLSELRNNSNLSAAQLSILEGSIDAVADEEDRFSIQRLNEELEDQAMAAGMDATAVNELNNEWKETFATMTSLDAQLSTTQLQLIGLRQAVEQVNEKNEDFRQELGLTSLSLASFDLKALTTALVVEGLADSADDAEESFEELRRDINRLVPDNPATTLNLGPMNLSLENMVSTLGGLISFLGPIIMLLSAMAGAFLTAAAAITTFVGVGLIQFLDHVVARFNDIENRMEAMEALGGALMDLVEEAFAPIFEANIAGESPIEFFIGSVQSGLRVLRRFAEIMAMVTNLRSFESFLDEIGDALFSPGSGGTSLMEAIRIGTERALPLVTDLFTYLINAFPEFILYASRIAEQIGPDVAEFLRSFVAISRVLIGFGTNLIEIVATLAGYLATVVVAVNNILTAVDNLLGPLVDLRELLGDSFATIIVLIAVLLILNSTIQVLTNILGVGHVALMLYNALVGTSITLTQLWTTATAGLTVAMNALLTTLWIGGVLLAISIFIMRISEVSSVTEAFGEILLWLIPIIAYLRYQGIITFTGIAGSIGTAMTAVWGFIGSIWTAIASLTALEAAIAATGIGALLIIIGLIIYAMLNWQESTDALTSAWEEFVDILTTARDVILELISLGLWDTETFNGGDSPGGGQGGRGGRGPPPSGARRGGGRPVTVNVNGNVEDENKFARRIGGIVSRQDRRADRRRMGA